MAAEGELEKYLFKRVKRLKGETRKVKWIGRRNAPDRLIWTLDIGTAIFVELKAPGEKATRAQKREHKRLNKMGFYVAVWDSKEAIDRFLRVKT